MTQQLQKTTIDEARFDMSETLRVKIGEKVTQLPGEKETVRETKSVTVDEVR